MIGLDSGPLLLLLRGQLGLMKLGRKLLIDPLAERLLDKLARIAARLTGKTLGRDCGVAIGADDDFNLHDCPPATWMVSLIDPSARACSVTLWPRRFASRVVAQTAYVCKNFAKDRSSPHRP